MKYTRRIYFLPWLSVAVINAMPGIRVIWLPDTKPLAWLFLTSVKMYPRNNWYLKKILVLSDHLYICQSNLTNLATVQLNRGEGSWQQWTWIFPWSIECPRPWPPLLGMCPPSVHFRPYISTCYVNITMPSCLVSWFESQGKRGFALGKRWTVALCTKWPSLPV